MCGIASIWLHHLRDRLLNMFNQFIQTNAPHYHTAYKNKAIKGVKVMISQTLLI